MNIRRTSLRAIVGITLATAAACGGRVIIDQGTDGDGAGGAGGAGNASVSSSAVNSAAAGVLCSWPDPIGQLVPCKGSVGAGPTEDCSTAICDANGNVFEALCENTACQCRYNGSTMCTCAIDLPLDICAGEAKPCCPLLHQ